MKTIKRQEAIESIIEDELKIWKKKFHENDLDYFDDLLRNGGVLIGFEDMGKQDLEDEYYEKFDEKVDIR